MSEFRLLSSTLAEAVDGCSECGARFFRVLSQCRCPAFDAKLECVGCGHETKHTFNPEWRK